MSLRVVYDGWEGVNRSLRSAIGPLTLTQLDFRPTPEMRSVRELSWHISHGRMDWWRRLDRDGADQLFERLERCGGDLDSMTGQELSLWLDETWTIIAATLDDWTVSDLSFGFEHAYHGTVFFVTRQWVIWRILSHDIHHGGQLSELLAMQGIFPEELTHLGGHLTEPRTVRADDRTR